MLLAMVAMFDMELEQLDVKTTFLHGELEEQIFYASTGGVCCSRKRRSFLFVEKIIIFFEVVSSATV